MNLKIKTLAFFWTSKRKKPPISRTFKSLKRLRKPQAIAISVVSAAAIGVGVFIYFHSFAAIPVYHDHWEYWGPRIKYCESGGNYRALNPESTASGAWQILDGTWNGYGGYRRAYYAPPQVQDQKALQLFQTRGTQPWDASYHCWGRLAVTPKLPPPPPAAPVNQQPKAAVEQLGVGRNCEVSGWAYDPTEQLKSVPVHIYVDGPIGKGQGAEVTADISRADVNQAQNIGGSHGWHFDMPGNFLNGQKHALYIYVPDTQDPNNTLAMPSVDINCHPVGEVSEVDGGSLGCNVRGWAYDPSDTLKPITVRIYENGPAGQGKLVTAVIADQEVIGPKTGDIIDQHGWNFKLPGNFQDSNDHSLYIYAVDNTDSKVLESLAYKGQSPQIMNCARANP